MATIIVQPGGARAERQRLNLTAIAHNRLMLLLILFMGITSVVILRLLWIGIFAHGAGSGDSLSPFLPARADIVDRNGVPLEVGYFRTQHISAKTAETALQAVLSKEGRVAVLEREDRLLVTDYAENLAMAEKVLLRIDHPRPQVRIVALMYDISLQDIEQIGINWNPTLKGRIDAAGDPLSSLEADSITSSSPVTRASRSSSDIGLGTL